MVQQTPPEDGPFGLFRYFYALLARGSLVLLIAVFTWLVWTLLTRTAAGTTQGKSIESVRPTLTALAAAAPSEADATGCATIQLPAACAACHRVAGTSAAGSIGPDLTNIASVAAERIKDPGYLGSAKNAEAYIRESILQPSALVVPGAGYGTPNGSSLMPISISQSLSDAEI